MLLLNRARALGRGDSGAAMVAVLGLIIVTAIIGATVTAVSVNALGFTSATRSGVQALAAAEAGIDQALVDIQVGCTPSRSVSGAPRFEYELAYAVESENPVWQPGCPPAEAELVRIVATGYAVTGGIAGADSGDTRSVEAVYAMLPVYVEVPQVDPAVYAHTMEGIFRNFVLDSSEDSISADVRIKNGNVVCENGATIDGHVVLANGYVELDNCDVNGSVHVSQYVDAGGNNTVVAESVIALGHGVAGDVVRTRLGAIVLGDVHAGGTSRIDSRVDGDFVVAGDSASIARVENDAVIGGDVASSGPVEIDPAATVRGSVSSGVSGFAALPDPRVPEWTDIPYPSSSWDGFTEVTWSGSCSVGNSHAFWDSLATLTATQGDIVVNALSCGAAGIDFQNNIRSLVLSANVSFVAWKFNVDKLVVDSDDATMRYLWFNVPDNTADQQPTCSGDAGTITLTNEADIAATIAAMVYTPCKIISDRNNWRGQLYGGTMEFLQQAQLEYVPVGVPGVDFDASLPPVTELDSSVLGDRVSYRELGSDD